MLFSFPKAVETASALIERAGGRAMLVGGAIIDLLAGREPKDWDIEVFGLSLDKIEEIFSSFNPQTVGKSFGIIKVEIEGFDLDLSVPRRENKVGVGHKGFAMEFDPSMTPKEAALRRDFSINAMALNLRTGELADPFGGKKDLENGILRVTNPATFVEDPLRVFRAMQLLARKSERVESASIALMRSMVGELSDLPKERIFEEFSKLLLKASRPSVGFNFLRECGVLALYPELSAMICCEQRVEWHAEGDVWTHSCLAVDAAAEIRHLIPADQRLAFMWGVFLHDIGKPATTITREHIEKARAWNGIGETPRVIALANKKRCDLEDLHLTAIGHDRAGVDPAKSFLGKITVSPKLIGLTCCIVSEHMQPGNLSQGGAKRNAYAKLARKMNSCGGSLELIGRVCQCDSCASGVPGKKSLKTGTPDWAHKSSELVLKFAEEFDNSSALSPKVQGRDLIRHGLKPGASFRPILAKCLEVQDANPDLSADEILEKVL